MIIRFVILFVFFPFAFSDEHIARQEDIAVNHKPDDVADLLTKEIISETEIKAVKVEAINPERLNDLVNPPKGNQLPNAGANQFRDSSYITFTTLIKQSSVECFFYKARKSFDVDFQVLKGGDFDIALQVRDHTSKQVAFHKSAGDGTIKVFVPTEMIDTDYSICLDNQQTSWHTKKVFLMIDVEGPSGVDHPDIQNGEYAQLEKHMTKLDLMNTALANIYESLIKVEHHQERRRLVESIDRSIMESNYEYVTHWALIQILLMVLVAAVQLVMIRSLFDDRGGLGGKIWTKLNSLTGGRL